MDMMPPYCHLTMGDWLFRQGQGVYTLHPAASITAADEDDVALAHIALGLLDSSGKANLSTSADTG